MQQDLVDFSLLKTMSIAKLGTSSIAFQMMTYLTFNEFSNNTLTFGGKSSANFKLVVESVDWISKSISSLDRIKANANLQTTRREAAPHFNVGRLYELIANSKDQNHSHQLIVRYKCSKISLHFCKDCRIFCEGVKDDGGVVVKQRSAYNLDVDKMWRRSSKSNNNANAECFVSHQVDAASKHGADWEGNNSMKRLIIPFILTLEAEMQMAVNVFKLAGDWRTFHCAKLFRCQFPVGCRVNSDLRF